MLLLIDLTYPTTFVGEHFDFHLHSQLVVRLLSRLAIGVLYALHDNVISLLPIHLRVLDNIEIFLYVNWVKYLQKKIYFLKNLIFII